MSSLNKYVPDLPDKTVNNLLVTNPQYFEKVMENVLERLERIEQNQKKLMGKKQSLSTKEVADLLGKNKQTIIRMFEDKRLKGMQSKDGARITFPVESIREYAKEQGVFLDI